MLYFPSAIGVGFSSVWLMDPPVVTNRIVELCRQASQVRETAWGAKTKSYRSPGAEDEARLAAEEMIGLRDGLVQPVLDECLGFSDGQDVSAPFLEPKEKNRWRNQIWIDSHFSTDMTGSPIGKTATGYNRFGLAGEQVNCFRIWFTHQGVGIGLRPAPPRLDGTKIEKDQQAGAYRRRFSDLLQKYQDREPTAGSWLTHPLGLEGQRGRVNIYLALWWPSFESDQEFLEAVHETWMDIGPVLTANRI
jgi:hypothetical protein